MSLMIRCAHCRRSFHPDPRVKNQRFCGAAACQRARKTLWQRQKMASDPDYKENQRACQKDWQKRHPRYWRTYRARHPGYCRRNRLLQRLRDRKRPLKSLAKMDASRAISSVKPGTYYLIPQLAKMDALAQKVLVIPVP
jgi:hypothetical protein